MACVFGKDAKHRWPSEEKSPLMQFSSFQPQPYLTITCFQNHAVTKVSDTDTPQGASACFPLHLPRSKTTKHKQTNFEKEKLTHFDRAESTARSSRRGEVWARTAAAVGPGPGRRERQVSQAARPDRCCSSWRSDAESLPPRGSDLWDAHGCDQSRPPTTKHQLSPSDLLLFDGSDRRRKEGLS